MNNTWLDTVVEDRRDETDRIVVLELLSADGSDLPEFAAGAHVDVLVNERLGLVRQYSLCGPPHDRSRYRLAVLIESASRGGSAGMHALSKGDLVRVSKPRNKFGIDDEARRHVLLAGGIGITPLLAMSHTLDSIGAEYEMHYCARSRSDAAFVEDLEDDPRVTLHFDNGPDDQRLSLSTDVGSPRSDTALYVCGPGGFMDFVVSSALNAGWDASSIHMERFAPTEANAASKDDESFIVRLARSGREFEVPPQDTVLDVLLHNEVDAPYSCQQGICGECVVAVLAGEPDHRDDVLTDREHEQGQFATCTSRSHSTILELDL
ncbi:vanillate O-demethylase oxidoreductase (plasmid) [Rhodococcus erythropolis R138]|uniref:PDR/VanB family oxidoreductase n=1 Tax=Rhodococcus erythropolis TaxID=1833 RepID=UPI00049289E2|nr:PDR/VanB family oxidoreductase [Rhodococcus erythropolis]ALU73461.1 vanillate O-demethylase oxidoreductase [Rhodococcus erythropolis R138]